MADRGESIGILRPERYRRPALIALAAALGVAMLTRLAAPDYLALAWYALYAIPAHLFISVLANEPMLFAAARSYPPGLVAAAGTSGALVAIILDYALIGWFVNHRFVRAELEDSRAMRVAQRIFGKAPFVLITLSALLPVPFYPAKILAIARGYPLRRFLAALVLGRMPRFWFLAVVGERVQASNSALGSAAVVLGLFAAWGIWRTARRNRPGR